jgi:hypothetical protein
MKDDRLRGRKQGHALSWARVQAGTSSVNAEHRSAARRCLGRSWRLLPALRRRRRPAALRPRLSPGVPLSRDGQAGVKGRYRGCQQDEGRRDCVRKRTNPRWARAPRAGPPCGAPALRCSVGERARVVLEPPTIGRRAPPSHQPDRGAEPHRAQDQELDEPDTEVAEHRPRDTEEEDWREEQPGRNDEHQSPG